MNENRSIQRSQAKSQVRFATNLHSGVSRFPQELHCPGDDAVTYMEATELVNVSSSSDLQERLTRGPRFFGRGAGGVSGSGS